MSYYSILYKRHLVYEIMKNLIIGGPRFVRIERRPYLNVYFFLINKLFFLNNFTTSESHCAIYYIHTRDVYTDKFSSHKLYPYANGKRKKHILLFSRGYGKLDYT